MNGPHIMVFIEWWLVCRFAILFGVLILACISIWLVRRRRRLVRIVVAVIGSPIAVLAALLLGLQALPLGCLSYSAPIYTPDHTKAARVRTDDEGATGGNSQVEIFWNHGFSAEDVYWGEWRSVDGPDIRWISNNSVEIIHDDPMYDCHSTPNIAVRCIPRIKPEPNP
jgi:hypothetical protein